MAQSAASLTGKDSNLSPKLQFINTIQRLSVYCFNFNQKIFHAQLNFPLGTISIY